MSEYFQGTTNQYLSPNFRLGEFRDASGQAYVHRDLLGALQMLRDAHDGSISVRSMQAPAAVDSPAPRGEGVLIEAADGPRLANDAEALIRDGWLARVTQVGTRLWVDMPDPADPPPVLAEQAFDYVLRVTAAYETSGDPYLQVTGNFDQQGLSFGPIQVNLGTGTLQELFRRLRARNEDLLRQCFDSDIHYEEFQQVLDGPRTRALAWADARSIGHQKQGIAQPWRGYLQAVGSQPVFQIEMRRQAYDGYGRRVLSTLAFLRGLSALRIADLRCLAALFDMCVQQGSVLRAEAAIRRRVAEEAPEDEFTLTRLVVEERARAANPQWRADALSRRLGILDRQAVAVTIDGIRARRANPRLYLLRNGRVKRLDAYLEDGR